MSGARVELLVNRSQILTIDVGVDLRRGNVDVTEHLLHRSQICAALQQMRGERVTQRVWRDRLGDSRLIDVLAQNFPGSHPRKRLTAGVEKEDALPFTFFQPGPQLAQVDRDRPYCSATNGNEALLRSFAENAHEMILQHHVADTERYPFGDAQARAV